MAPAPTEMPAEMFLVPDLGMPGRLGATLGAPWALALGRCEPQTSHCRGQSSALSMGTFWVAIWDVYTVCFGSTLVLQTPITDLEIWTFGIDICDLAYILSITVVAISSLLDYFW